MNKYASCALVLLALSACKGKTEAPPAPSATAVPAPVGSVRPTELSQAQHGPAIPITSGPALLILPGQGVGPIRIGATVATIERLMDKPCDEPAPGKDEKVCRYQSRAVEFFLDDKGFTREIRIHRSGRQVETKPEQTYGIFKGRAESGLAPLMLKPALKEVVGVPLKTEPVKEPGKWNSVEVLTYNGMNLEIDRMPNGSEVVGGIYIVKG